MPKTAALRAAVFQLSAKNLKGVSKHPPPGPARVKVSAGLTVDCQNVRYIVFFLLPGIDKMDSIAAWLRALDFRQGYGMVDWTAPSVATWTMEEHQKAAYSEGI